MNKKILIGIIIGGIIFGSVGVYAGSNMYANSISVNAPTGSNLGSDATLQSSLDELYSIADKYDELNKKINTLENNTLTLDKIYPVGSIYISTDITSASDVASKIGGTWEVYGSGRTLVGVNTSDTNFNTVSKTGGNSTTTLSTSNLPSHNHNVTAKGTVTSTFTGTSVNTGESGEHSHSQNVTANTGGKGIRQDYVQDATKEIYKSYPQGINTGKAGIHHHKVTAKGTVTSTFTGTTVTSTSTGSGSSFSNLQPYITVYMYKRIK